MAAGSETQPARCPQSGRRRHRSATGTALLDACRLRPRRELGADERHQLHSRSDTYPTIRISEDDVNVGHEATVSKVGDDQLFYLMSHGIPEDEASKLIVNGFIEPITKELPMEYAVEMNRLIELQMEGSIG